MRKKQDSIKRKGTSLVDARKNKTFKNYRQNMCIYKIYIPSRRGHGEIWEELSEQKTEVKLQAIVQLSCSSWILERPLTQTIRTN